MLWYALFQWLLQEESLLNHAMCLFTFVYIERKDALTYDGLKQGGEGTNAERFRSLAPYSRVLCGEHILKERNLNKNFILTESLLLLIIAFTLMPCAL